MHASNEHNSCSKGQSRRSFLKRSTAAATILATPPAVVRAAEKKLDEKGAEYFEKLPLNVEVNGKPYSLSIEPRVTLLDFLRIFARHAEAHAEQIRKVRAAYREQQSN